MLDISIHGFAYCRVCDADQWARGPNTVSLDPHLVWLILPFASSAMHPSFVRLSSTTARASTIGFIGLGRMGYEMALNAFSKTIINHDLQRQTNGSTLGSNSNALPRFTVCDVNEDAANNLASVMRERFPGVDIAIRRTPAEYVYLSICSFPTELLVRIAASASTVITMLPSSPHVQVSSTVNNKPYLKGSSLAGRLPENVRLHCTSTHKAAQRRTDAVHRLNHSGCRCRT